MHPCIHACTYITYAGLATDKPQATVAKKRAAVPAPSPSTFAGAPPPPPPAEPSATGSRAATTPAPGAAQTCSAEAQAEATSLCPELAPLTAEEGLIRLEPSDSVSGYKNVFVRQGGSSYEARVLRDGKQSTLGRLATAKEAALVIAREKAHAADSSGQPTAAPATTSSAASSATADPAPRADTLTASLEGRLGAKEGRLEVGHNVEAHYDRDHDEMWWPAVVTKARYHEHRTYTASHCALRGALRGASRGASHDAHGCGG